MVVLFPFFAFRNLADSELGCDDNGSNACQFKLDSSLGCSGNVSVQGCNKWLVFLKDANGNTQYCVGDSESDCLGTSAAAASAAKTDVADGEHNRERRHLRRAG
jgi:hypothetical protein